MAVLLMLGSARAEMHALLVGVSDYPTLPADVERTPGARNDVLLMREVLLRRGFRHDRIGTLADGLPDAQPPTRANILQALDDISAAVEPGDTVLVHFSGHGSLEPGARPGEGPSPIFLPADIGRWDGGIGAVTNAITRQDLRLRMDRITDRGAFVWGVFDACHSTALVRGPETTPRPVRFVAPSALGVPADAIEHRAPTRGAVSSNSTAPHGIFDRSPGARPTQGGTAFFYAAQAGESAVELKLPLAAETSAPHGLFSFLVAQVLQRARPMNHRQLGQAVQAAYAYIPQAYATPVFTGNALDRQVLGQATVPVRQWPLRIDDGPLLDAGVLSGLVKGTVLALLPGPLAADAELLGYLRVASAGLAWARLEALPHAGKPAPGRDQFRSGQFLRVASSPPELRLRVRHRVDSCPGQCVLNDAVRELRKRGVAGVEVLWVESAEAADVVLDYRPGRIDIVPSPGNSSAENAEPSSPAVTSLRPGDGPESTAVRLALGLRALARSNNLLALARRNLDERPADWLVVELRRAGTTPPIREVITPDRPTAMWPGNQLVLDIENRGQLPVDVTVLYIDANHGITALFPGWRGESNRLMPGVGRRVADLSIMAPPSGIERLVVIGRQAAAGAERSDFSFLAQSGADRAGTHLPADYEVLADAAFADHQRRGRDLSSVLRRGTSIVLYTLDVQPASGKPPGRRTSPAH